MKAMLRLFFFRLKKFIYFYVIVGIMVALGVLLDVIFGLEGLHAGNGNSSTSRYSVALACLTWGPILLGLAVVTFFGTDWGSRTFRMPLLSGISRGKMFASAAIFVFLLYLIFVLLVAGPSLLVTLCFPYWGATKKAEIGYDFLVLLSNGLMLAYLALLCSFLIRGTAGAVWAYLGCVMLSFAVGLIGLNNLVREIINNQGETVRMVALYKGWEFNPGYQSILAFSQRLSIKFDNVHSRLFPTVWKMAGVDSFLIACSLFFGAFSMRKRDLA